MPRQSERQRDPTRIRTDAIKLGTQKAMSGCQACANSYFELAREHGASEEEIRLALEHAIQPPQKGLSRRELLKIAAVSGLTLSSAAFFKARPAEAVSAWWGTDSLTQSCCQMPQNFYIGRLGYGAEPTGDAYYFNTRAAAVAGYDNTFGYWGIQGPNFTPPGMSYYNWGRRQADSAWNAWLHGPHHAYTGGYTIFGDIEAGFGGWINGFYGPSQDVINGFCTELYNITPARPVTWPGIYITPYSWSVYFGTGFRTTTPFVLYLSGCDTCGGDLCSPCNTSCNTLTTVQRRLASTIVNIGLGGMQPVVWQYWISDCNCGDFDVATQHTNSFGVDTGGPTFSHC